jgi:hypothetical protein
MTFGTGKKYQHGSQCPADVNETMVLAVVPHRH